MIVRNVGAALALCAALGGCGGSKSAQPDQNQASVATPTGKATSREDLKDKTPWTHAGKRPEGKFDPEKVIGEMKMKSQSRLRIDIARCEIMKQDKALSDEEQKAMSARIEAYIKMGAAGLEACKNAK